MDFDSADIPPIPMRAHNHHAHSRRRSLQGPSSSKRNSGLPPASPEVISNLITSLSVISKPATNHFEASPTSLSLPASPGNGSFGVDYGAFHQPSLDDLRQDPVSLDELAALPPVIRTSKPPSGYSPLTATKSPRSPRSPSREGSGGLRSFIRNSTSRPSSKGSSAASKNDDAQSIGNLSIERRGASTPELNHKQSHDSWGRKTSRSQKGLMYMSSKERLREKEAERKRVSGGVSASSSGALPGESVHSGGRSDPFFAETAIREESFRLRIPLPVHGSELPPLMRNSSSTLTIIPILPLNHPSLATPGACLPLLHSSNSAFQVETGRFPHGAVAGVSALAWSSPAQSAPNAGQRLDQRLDQRLHFPALNPEP